MARKHELNLRAVDGSKEGLLWNLKKQKTSSIHEMKKEQSQLGLTSFIFSLVPLLGFGVIFFVKSIDLESSMIPGFSWITIIFAPVIGLALGIISLFKKTYQLIFPIIGTTLNLGWIIFLVWGYFKIMTMAYR